MIEIAWEQVAWVSGVLAIAATIQGVAGFGFMLIAAAGLIQVYPAQLVVPGWPWSTSLSVSPNLFRSAVKWTGPCSVRGEAVHSLVCSRARLS